MQPTALNKVISLFLIGGIGLLLLVLLLWRHAGPMSLPTEATALINVAGEGFVAVVGGLLVVSAATILGVACEALTDITVRRALIKSMRRWKWVPTFFKQAKLLKDYNHWRDRFRAAVLADVRLKGALMESREHSLAVGIFYTSASEGAIAWVESHYATYLLVSNLAFLAAVLEIYILTFGVLGFYSWRTVVVWGVLLIGLMYAFCCFALDRYLYSYQFPLRHSTMTLLLKEGTAKESDNSNAT